MNRPHTTNFNFRPSSTLDGKENSRARSTTPQARAVKRSATATSAAAKRRAYGAGNTTQPLSRRVPSTTTRVAQTAKSARLANATASRTTTAASRTTRTIRGSTTTTKPTTTRTRNASSRPVSAPSRRPAWDIKGRLADMEALTSTLQSSVQSNEDMVAILKTQLKEKNNELEQVAETKQTVEKDLSEYEKNLTETKEKLKETEEKLKESENKIEKIEKETKEQKEKAEADARAAASQMVVARDKIATQELKIEQMQIDNSKILLELEQTKELLKKEKELTEQQSKQIEEQKEAVAYLESKVRGDEMMRRKLHNQIQELKGNIRVFCRVRPVLPIDNESDECFSFPPLTTNTLQVSTTQTSAISSKYDTKNKKTFTFDRVFTPNSTQEQVFDEISALVQSSLDGYNTCIFTYGQTGSGKTYTMEGPDIDHAGDAGKGMIPRTVEQIFSTSENLKEAGWHYTMQVMYLEIYNETIFDLLVSNSSSSKTKLDIKQDEKGDPGVPGARVVGVDNPRQIYDLLRIAARNRAVAATLCNARSSRSHSVFQLSLAGRNTITGESATGLLNLIDLAGSERVDKSGSTGDRLKEAVNINKSLSCLGDVIMSLANKDRHVPYRNSKLTHLLSTSLGGQSKTLMFVNVAPTLKNVKESISALRFAQKVNACEIGTARKDKKINLKH